MKHFLPLVFFSLSLLAIMSSLAQNPPLKAVNLGCWLVAEGWLKPSLFTGIPNNDLLDGTQVQFRSAMLNKYLSAENGGGAALVANRQSASGWETFRLWRIDENTFNFRVFNKQFIGLTMDGERRQAVARKNEPGPTETFKIVRNNRRVRIQASNGLYLQASSSGDSVMASYQGSSNDWGDQNPSVFEMNIVKTLRGEFQLTNGYGSNRAPKIMQDHWNSYITENDFKFMSENGINGVRIPVGWWIMYDRPPKPFVRGSLQALDNAFTWARKYNMKVIVNLHAVPGSQNVDEHSGTRDGYVEWGDSKIDETVKAIDFLAKRYAANPSLVAVELMNEPHAISDQEAGVSLESLSKYYKAGYNAIRKYTSNAYVILSNRLGGAAKNTELLSLAQGLSRSVIDVHYYNLYSSYFEGLTVQQHIDYVNNERVKQLQEVTPANGPLSFVGEWSAALPTEKGNPSNDDYKRYGRAQIQVYGKATFGWAYWTYKCESSCGAWSLQSMIQNNIINLKTA